MNTYVKEFTLKEPRHLYMVIYLRFILKSIFRERKKNEKSKDRVIKDKIMVKS